MIYSVLVVPREQVSLWEPFMVFGFVRKYPLAKVGCVVFCDFVFVFVCVRVVVYYRLYWELYVVLLDV